MKLLEKIKLDYKKIILGEMVANGLFLLYGLYLYMYSYETTDTVGLFMGIFMMLLGVYQIYKYFNKDKSVYFKNKMGLGIFYILVALGVIINPLNMTNMITLGLGLSILGLGAIKLIDTWKLKKEGFAGFKIYFLTSIIMLGFGLLVAINPLKGIDIVQVVGIFIILSSILELSNVYMMYNKN